MRQRRWTLIALLACAPLIVSCAGSPRTLAAAPPQLTLPETARTACDLHRLSENPTQGDLEAAYLIRGAQIAECEGRRRLAVETWDAERALGERHRQAREDRARPWWARLRPG